MKYSKRRITEICKHIADGATQKDAALMAGISQDTFCTWKKEKPEFSERLFLAETKYKNSLIKTIKKATKKSWMAAAWLLGNKFSDEYAVKTKNEISGPNGKPIQTENKDVSVDTSNDETPTVRAAYETLKSELGRP